MVTVKSLTMPLMVRPVTDARNAPIALTPAR